MKKSLAICFIVLAVSVGSADARPFRGFRPCRPHRCDNIQCRVKPTQRECCSECEGVVAAASDTDFNDLQIAVNNLRKDFSDYRNKTDQQITELKEEIERLSSGQ